MSKKKKQVIMLFIILLVVVGTVVTYTYINRPEPEELTTMIYDKDGKKVYSNKRHK